MHDFMLKAKDGQVALYLLSGIDKPELLGTAPPTAAGAEKLRKILVRTRRELGLPPAPLLTSSTLDYPEESGLPEDFNAERFSYSVLYSPAELGMYSDEEVRAIAASHEHTLRWFLPISLGALAIFGGAYLLGWRPWFSRIAR